MSTDPEHQQPRISVVIPTYQRRDLVVGAVRALTAQSFEQPFEVIVVVDGSTDGTAEALRSLSVPFPLRVVDQPNRGAATARNHGASKARGAILLFLDDDMEADALLLEEHYRVHAQGADAVLGHIPLHPASPASLLSDGVARWADERLGRLSQPEAVLTLHDLLTGQLSVSASVFREVSGFDTAFTHGGSFGNEDVDFGHRLLRGGYDIRFNPGAISYQQYVVTPRQHLRQWRQAGAADVLFARKHPQEALELFVLNGLPSRFAKRVARPLARVPMWSFLTAPIRAVAVSLGNLRGSKVTRLFFYARALEYWRGVLLAGDIPRHGSLRVLAYHAISDLRGRGPLEPYGVPVARFRQQLATLRRWGFHVISSQEFMAYLDGRAGLPRRAVMLTFDDCFVDLLDAAGILGENGSDGVAFAVSGLLGGRNDWDRHYGGPPLHLLDAAGLERLQGMRWEIGAHSRSHRALTALAPADVADEVRGSIDDLRKLGLGDVRLFAYPYGEHDGRVREIARDAGVTAAFTTASGVVQVGSDRLQLPRIEIVSSDGSIRFLAKVAFPRTVGRLDSGRRRAAGLSRGARRMAGKAIRRVV